MESVVAPLEGLALAEWLRYSRWGYASVNAIHILGIALLLGAVLPLSLRLLGLWSFIELGQLYCVLSRVAAVGLVVAVASGMLLFVTRATEYAVLDLFYVKLALIAGGLVHASILHFGARATQISRAQRRFAGVLSLLLWPAVLVCGRLLAFV